MSILCKWEGHWCLAQRARPESQGCSLAVQNAIGALLASVGFQRYTYGTFWHRHFPGIAGITFYPEVYYRGVQVFPQHWHPESSEPLVACHMPLNVRPGETAEQSRARRQTLLDEGWTYSAWEGLARYVHVDELQKIEGPPPEGAF